MMNADKTVLVPHFYHNSDHKNQRNQRSIVLDLRKETISPAHKY